MKKISENSSCTIRLRIRDFVHEDMEIPRRKERHERRVVAHVGARRNRETLDDERKFQRVHAHALLAARAVVRGRRARMDAETLNVGGRVKYHIYNGTTGEEGDRSDSLRDMKERAQLEADGARDMGMPTCTVHVIESKTGTFLFTADGVSCEEKHVLKYGTPKKGCNICDPKR